MSDRWVKEYKVLVDAFHSVIPRDSYWFNDELMEYDRSDIHLEHYYNEVHNEGKVVFSVYYQPVGIEELDRQLTLDIERLCKYVWIPKTKQILKEHNLSLRVEFINKRTRRKIIKGFITKE